MQVRISGNNNVEEQENLIINNLTSTLLSFKSELRSIYCPLSNEPHKIIENEKGNITNYSGVIPHDKLLIGKQAKKILDGVKDSQYFKKDRAYYLKSNKDEKDNYEVFHNLHQSEFDFFYNDFYKKGKTYREDLLKVEKVDDNDPRTALHGQDRVIAKTSIPKDTIIGIYTGIYLNEDINNDNKDLNAECNLLSQDKKFKGMKTINAYSFTIALEDTSLCLSAYGRSNILIKINANTTYSKDAPKYKNNIIAAI